MPSRQEWVTIITGRGGRIYGVVSEWYAKKYDTIDASFLYKPGINQKAVRDLTARELRKDGWDVRVSTNSLGYHLEGERKKK